LPLQPLLAQVQTSAFSGGMAGLIASSRPMARFVLALLLLFSLLSWAIILYKGLALHRARAQSETFLDIFRKSSKFSEVNAVCPQLKASPLVGVFQAGYFEVNQQVRGGGTGPSTSRCPARSPARRASRPRGSSGA
jgi:biopolymer transport protein TolQ